MSIRLKELEEKVDALSQSLDRLIQVVNAELPSTNPAMDSFVQNMNYAKNQIDSYKKSAVNEQMPFQSNNRHSSLLSMKDMMVLLKIYEQRLKQVDPHKQIIEYNDDTNRKKTHYFSYRCTPHYFTFHCFEFQRKWMNRSVQSALVTSYRYCETVYLPISGETIEWDDTVEEKFDYELLIRYFNGLIDHYLSIVGNESDTTYPIYPIDKRKNWRDVLCTTLSDVLDGNGTDKLQKAYDEITLQCYVDSKNHFQIELSYLNHGEYHIPTRLKLSLYYNRDNTVILNEDVILSKKSFDRGFRSNLNGPNRVDGFSGNIHSDNMFNQLMSALVHFLRHEELLPVYTYTFMEAVVHCHQHQLIYLPSEQEQESDSSEQPPTDQ